MTCMSLNDVNRGLALLIISFVDYPIFTKSWILCYILTSFIISTQCVAMFNLLFISIRRLINTKNVRRVQKGISSRKLTTLNISMCFAHFAMCLVLFIIWAHRDSLYLKTCCMFGQCFWWHITCGGGNNHVHVFLDTSICNKYDGYSSCFGIK